MRLKITPNSPPAGLVTDTTPPRATGVSGDSPASGAAKVAFSPTARALLSLSDGSSDIDMARVAEMRDAIAAGNLKIDTSRIADGFIASARDLLK
ncbi:MAG: flagellar biosynthesis anti-sigma factor FlgM [Burkholderiaceae bacterium]|nr:flagellar biosynthesis anti-sigma factor FlgM [Burkholderiaceae bacterium]